MAAALGLLSIWPAQAENENFSNKPAPALFNADCTGAGCHKGPQGLGKGQSQSSLAGFLREHYTNSRESAAALAGYILKMPPGAAQPEPKPTRASTQRGGTEPQRGGGSWFDPEPAGSGPAEGRPVAEPRNTRQQEKEKEKERGKPPTRAAARPTEAKPAEAKPEGKPAEAKPAEAKPAEGEEPAAAAEPAEPAAPKRRTAEPAEPKPAPAARNQRGRQQPAVAATPAPAPAEPAPPPPPAAPPPPPQYDIFD